MFRVRVATGPVCWGPSPGHHRNRCSSLVPSTGLPCHLLERPRTSASAPAPLEITLPARTLIAILPRREVDEWLWALVKGKTILVTEIQREAAARGYSWSRVKRAKERLGIESEKLEWREGWAWSLLSLD
jgi:hypothetical protein